MRAQYYEALMGKPDVDWDGRCSYCGRPAGNLHHVVPKGMGGVTAEEEHRIPKVRLCGMGNASGCHGLVHARLLHLQWCDAMGGWVALRTIGPMGDQEAWDELRERYRPLMGWVEQRRFGAPIGGRK